MVSVGIASRWKRGRCASRVEHWSATWPNRGIVDNTAYSAGSLYLNFTSVANEAVTVGAENAFGKTNLQRPKRSRRNTTRTTSSA
jgi:hypothetical protein